MARPEDRTGWRPCRLKAAVPESGSVVATAPRRPCPPVSLVLEGTADFTENHLREAEDRIERRSQVVADIGQELGFAPRRGLSLLHSMAENRSEEHTSELQSLMRISYAVFCLKKKKKP